MLLRFFTAFALAAQLILPARLRADDAPKVLDKNLEGVWEGVSAVRGGKDLGPPPGGKFIMTIKGDGVAVEFAKEETHSAKLKIDSTKTPPTFDLTYDDGPDKGKTSLGLYEVKGDELRIASSDPGGERPTGISSKEGTTWTLVTFKRVKK